ncbi:MAG: branched-chain amino acid ABC transporter permease [Nocardioidaceae bacterium]|nr:branched-chain amino acid ABC transporter permease [Nocardioidaceae bacterium]
MNWINAIVQGILLGGLYALLAAGLSVMFGVMRIVNLAHGSLAILAAYVGLVVIERTGVSPFVAMVLVVPIMAAVGYLLQLAVFNRALAVGPLAPLLAAFGLSVVVAQLLQIRFTSDSQTLATGSLGIASIKLSNDVAIGVLPLVIFSVGVAVIAGTQLFLNRTPLGRAMRATSDDPGTVALMGIDPQRVYALSTALAMAIVAVAGMFLGMRGNVDPNYGQAMLIFAFEAVIIGGLGSLWGTLIGGVVLGVAQAVGSQIDPSYGVLAGHLVFLGILAVRPTGLMQRVVTA